MPVYTYSNEVIRDSRDANATACDNATFDTDRNGYRLPTEAEWEYAARYTDGLSQTPGDFASGAGASSVNTLVVDAVAWNFKHLANIRREARFVAVNQAAGYLRSPRIVSPPEVEDESEE